MAKNLLTCRQCELCVAVGDVIRKETVVITPATSSLLPPPRFPTNTPCQDLDASDRSLTPWVLAMFHCPWYNSNLEHQSERMALTAMRTMEPLLSQHKAALVIAGHVHGETRFAASSRWLQGCSDSGLVRVDVKRTKRDGFAISAKFRVCKAHVHVNTTHQRRSPLELMARLADRFGTQCGF